MIQPYPGYKRFTLDSDIKGLKMKRQKKTYYTKVIKKKVEVTTLVWDEIDFKTKNCYQRQNGTFYNDKG